MSVLTDLVSGTESNRIVWVDHTTPIENTYYSIFGEFRADISPGEVKLVKHGQIIEVITSDFGSLTTAVATQRTNAIGAAKTELGDFITGVTGELGPTGPTEE